MVIDISKCNGCMNCQLACKDEHVENNHTPYALPQPDTGHFWMHVQERIRGSVPKVKLAYIATPCMHCENPPCMAAATGGAIYKRPDGIVMIDPAKSVGQRQLVASCPYGVIYWNEELGAPQKCTFCAHLLDIGWKEPRCVEACPDAMRFGDLDDPKSEVSKLVANAETLLPELNAKPRVFYLALPKNFIAGTISDAATREFIEGATITLTDPAGKTLTTKSDSYGDFWFEGLAPKTYSLKIESSGYKAATSSVELKTDTNLGEISLSK